MPKRYFNWKLAIVLVIGVVVLGVTAFALRRWQRGGRARRGLEAGNKAYNEQRWEEAAKNLGHYIAVAHDDVPTLLKYAHAQLNIRPLKRGNVQQAIAAYRTVLRVDKSNYEAAMRLTEMYLGIGASGEAELIARRHLEINPDPEISRMFAMALSRQRKFDEAAKVLENIITEHPDQVLAYETLGILALQRPEIVSQPPSHWFDEAVKNNPSSAMAYIIRANFHFASKDRPSALADLEQAESQVLSDPKVRLYLAGGFINAGLWDRAETHLAAVQNLEPTSGTLWQMWANLALKFNSRERMLKVAEDGLKELSSQPWDFMPRAVELFIRGDELDRASECISKLRQKDIAPPTTAFLEGLVADREGHPYEAVKCWHRTMELGNKSPRVRLALASALSRLGDTLSAIRQLRTLISERPDFFNGRLALANLLARTGNWAETVEQARRAMLLSPGNLEAALLHLQARIQLLAQNQTDKDSPAWQDIEDQLAALEKASDNALPVRVAQLQFEIQRSQFGKAQRLLNDLKQTHSSEIRIAMAEVELLVAQNKMGEAISMLNSAVERFPKALEPVRYLVVLLARQDNHEKCETVIKDALARIENPVATRELGLLLAELYSRRVEEDSAYSWLNALALKHPNDIPVKRRLLGSALVIKNFEKAQELVNDIKSLEGEDGWQWRYEQARVWFLVGGFEARYSQIISLLKKNLLTNPNDQASRRLLAAAYDRAVELQLAISTYRDALSRSPDDLRIIIPTVTALYRAGEYDQADDILNRASQQELYHPLLQELQFQGYLRRGQLSLASDTLEDFVGRDPNNQDALLSLALLKMQQDKFAKAGELLAKLKIQDPNSLPVTVAQVQLNIRQDRAEEAVRLCNEAVNNLNSAPAYIFRARTFASLGQRDRATEDFEHATVIEPNNVEVWVARSDFYRSTGQPDKATADIQQALSLAPDNIQIQQRAISLCLTSGNPARVQRGRTMLDKALESNPEHIELRLFKARTLLGDRTAPSIDRAMGILQNITEDQPENAEAWFLLGEISLRRRRPGRAMDVALRGLAHKPNDKMLLLLKARAEAARSPTLAIPTLKALRELDPNDAGVAILLANMYLTADQPQKAVSLLRKQLIFCSGTTDERRINIGLAAALHKNGNKQMSQDIFDSLYQSAPDDPTPLLVQARVLKADKLWSQLSQKVIDWCRHHPKDTRTPIIIANDLAASENAQAKKVAEDLLRTVLEHDPNFLPVITMLAMLLQTTDRSAESAALYQQILTFQPDNVIAINNLAWILCEEQGQHQRALELAQHGLEKTPDFVDLVDTRGVAYYRLGEFDKAIQDFRRCIKLYPTRMPSIVASYLHLGRAHAKLGQKDEALENLEKALELNTKIGGLSAADLVEAQRLLEELSQGV